MLKYQPSLRSQGNLLFDAIADEAFRESVLTEFRNGAQNVLIQIDDTTYRVSPNGEVNVVAGKGAS